MLKGFLFVVLLPLAHCAPIIASVGSTIALPNSTVILSGGSLAAVDNISVCDASGKCEFVKPVVAYEDSLVFIMPSNTPLSVIYASVCIAKLCSASVELNGPVVTFVTSDAFTSGQRQIHAIGSGLSYDISAGTCSPLTASSGNDDFVEVAAAASRLTASVTVDAVRLFNYVSYSVVPALSTAPVTTTLSVVDSKGKATPLTLLSASCYRVDAVLPDSLSPDTYTVVLNNGLLSTGRAVGVVVIGVNPSTWPSRVFPLGATGCESISACITTAQSNGGGIVSIPAGTYAMPANTGITLSDNVQVVGAGDGSTFITWASNTPTGAPSALVKCTGNGTLKAVTLNITSPVDTAVLFSGDTCALQDSTVWVDYTDASSPIRNTFAAMYASRWTVSGTTFLHRGNCSTAWPGNTAFYMRKAQGGSFTNSTVIAACQGFSIDSSQEVFVDALRVVSVGTDSQGQGFSTFNSPNVMENMYWGRGIDVGNPAATKRWESMTFDGPGGMYYGNVSMAGLTTSSFTVAGTPDNTPYLSPIGLAVTVLLGTGIGQVTRVVNASRDLKSWEVSPAFAVPLQEDSVISIVPFRGHCTYEGNAYLNDTTWQLFGTAFDVTGAGNYLFNTSGGMQAWGLWYQGGLQVNYGVVLDNNTLRCSGGVRAIDISDAPYNYTGPLNRMLTYRNNVLLSHSDVAMEGATWDSVLENNMISGGMCGTEDLGPGSTIIQESTQRVYNRGA